MIKTKDNINNNLTNKIQKDNSNDNFLINIKITT